MRFLSQMIRTKILLTIVGSVCLFASVRPALGDDPKPNRGNAPLGSQWAEQVVLGSSTVELNGPWKFHKGDDAR